MISIIVTSRIQGNNNHNLNKLIMSLTENTRNHENMELLVKFDEDDNRAPMLTDDILHYDLPFEIKVIFGNRGRGYIDIHHGYNRLLTRLSKESTIVTAMADDFTVKKDWDLALKGASEGSGEFFIIHQTPHPFLEGIPTSPLKELRPNSNFHKFDMSLNMFHSEELHPIDGMPAWSTQLLIECAMYGTVRPSFDTLEVFPISFTDAWTLCLEFVLWNEYKINITKFVDEPVIVREVTEKDQPFNQERWMGDRKNNFDYIKSSSFRNIVEHQAREIACRLRSLQTAK